MPPRNSAAKSQLLVASGAFSLPLAIFSRFARTDWRGCWRFWQRYLWFPSRSKSSRLIGLGATWLAIGCGAALLWALLIGGLE